MHTSSRYTFVSSPQPSLAQQHHQSLHHHHHLHHHGHHGSHAVARRNSDRCDVHHSVAQLYLRTLPSLDALPRPSHSDTHVGKPSSRRRRSCTKPTAVAMRAADITTTTTATTAATATAATGAGAGVQVAKSPTASFNPSGSFILSQQEVFPALSSTDESEVSSSSSSSSLGRGERGATRTQLRAFLASSMSSMYRREVPLYGDLLSIISTVNSDVIRAQPDAITDDEISRLNVERHGAIRVGTPQELNLLARIFKLFGMHAVGYYDLAKDAGLPIHATAFRPVGSDNLLRNPFRIFCSLLRMDLIQDARTRRLAEELLGQRQIVSDRCVELLCQAEAAQGSGQGERVGGLSRAEALEFVEHVVDIFAWHADTPVSLSQYQLLAQVHPLVADIVSFRGPHINHLTPRTLDIDAVQRTMLAQRIDAKDVIEGPPARAHPIYLRQTSFHALSEQVTFLGDNGGGGGCEQAGRHKARFGEIEARGQALTRRGARLYDALMHQVQLKRAALSKSGDKVGKDECVAILQQVFRDGFPDSRQALLSQGLGFFAFSLKDRSLAEAMLAEREAVAVAEAEAGCGLLARMVEQGALEAEPITYEDFLPASAAGIFQSNLPQTTTTAQPVAAEQQKEDAAQAMDDAQARERLEAAVGGKILDYFALYAEQQRKSVDLVAAALGTDMHDLAEALDQAGA